MKEFNKEVLLQQAQQKHPEAENTYVAIDLYAQDVFTDFIKDAGNKNFYDDNEENIELYHVLCVMRREEAERILLNQSQILTGVENEKATA